MLNADQAMTIREPNVQVKLSILLCIHSKKNKMAHFKTKTFNFCIIVCTCLPGYTGKKQWKYSSPLPPNEIIFWKKIIHTGNPLSHCVRGECQSDSECPDSRACINYSCVDPCIGQCGANAICEAQRHIAVCKCPRGYDGNAASSCVRQSRAYYPFSRYYKKKWTTTQSKRLLSNTNVSNETYTLSHWQILDLKTKIEKKTTTNGNMSL